MGAITFYNYELDERCYRVRLLLSMLKIEPSMVSVNMFPGLEHKKPHILNLNPRGELPILEDGALVLSGTEAVLCYLAKAYGPAWLPEDPALFGKTQMWLGFGASALDCAYLARLDALFATGGDKAALKKAARAAFRIMDDHMTTRHFSGKQWFVGDAPSLADLTLLPSFALSRDYGVDHDEFPALRTWLRAFRALPHFITMPGIPDYH